MLAQCVPHQDPFPGRLFVFRGCTRANLIKVIDLDGTGFCLFTKRLEHGGFLLPPSLEASGTLSLTSARCRWRRGRSETVVAPLCQCWWTPYDDFSRKRSP
jgi:transposase